MIPLSRVRLRPKKEGYMGIGSRNPILGPFFGLRWTRLNGMIPSPYHEATLDTFGFPVGAHLAACQAA